MLRPRIIPCLLVQDGGLVKTRKFSDAKYVGDPVNAVKIFNEKEADELIVIDIDATVQQKAPNERLISQIAAECRMPLCYGGGIKTVEHAKRIISFGVEKIALSSAAIEKPDLISEIAEEIGGQSVVVVLDVRRGRDGSYMAFTHNGKVPTGQSIEPLIMSAMANGVGEIVVNSIDNDGMMLGLDLALARLVRSIAKVPITLMGGAGSLSDIEAVINACGTVGVAAGSLFVFKGAYRAVLISYPSLVQRDSVFGNIRHPSGQRI